MFDLGIKAGEETIQPWTRTILTVLVLVLQHSGIINSINSINTNNNTAVHVNKYYQVVHVLVYLVCYILLNASNKPQAPHRIVPSIGHRFSRSGIIEPWAEE